MAQFSNKLCNITENTNLTQVKPTGFLNDYKLAIINNYNNYQNNATCATQQILSIKSLLILNNSHTSKEYYQELYEERVSIMYYDGGVDINEAKKAAFNEITSLYLENELLLKGSSNPPEEQYVQTIQTFKRWGIGNN
ncbi:hypothetical protein [Rickettsiales endosymbiont of Stachyamoeba lipophora]|uniref:hypothetical protein n=1 Tax=Rickettsiales endosymbiont of Stachyamoeba lipophora TaxID=2486578 RepID=UPI000F64DC0B|nr:hypothetical protein [Rickettsiales endosymbiont of Stachyamoeba lipophora]AZL15905.1 hypothetical protein EF513_05025 [Rickettsiales endosymbiont of Stachyamoeba lipophora]